MMTDEQIRNALASAKPFDGRAICHHCGAGADAHEPEHHPGCLWVEANRARDAAFARQNNLANALQNSLDRLANSLHDYTMISAQMTIDLGRAETLLVRAGELLKPTKGANENGEDD
jgi:hypothetical protein